MIFRFRLLFCTCSALCLYIFVITHLSWEGTHVVCARAAAPCRFDAASLALNQLSFTPSFQLVLIERLLHDLKRAIILTSALL
jgi:hypothetical protein